MKKKFTLEIKKVFEVELISIGINESLYIRNDNMVEFNAVLAIDRIGSLPDTLTFECQFDYKYRMFVYGRADNIEARGYSCWDSDKIICGTLDKYKTEIIDQLEPKINESIARLHKKIDGLNAKQLVKLTNKEVRALL